MEVVPLVKTVRVVLTTALLVAILAEGLGEGMEPGTLVIPTSLVAIAVILIWTLGKDKE